MALILDYDETQRYDTKIIIGDDFKLTYQRTIPIVGFTFEMKIFDQDTGTVLATPTVDDTDIANKTIYFKIAKDDTTLLVTSMNVIYEIHETNLVPERKKRLWGFIPIYDSGVI